MNTGSYVDEARAALEKEILRTFLFHAIFLSLLACEFFLVTIAFTLLAKSATLALAFALLFMTGFSYFLVKEYLGVQRRQRIKNIVEKLEGKEKITSSSLFIHKEDHPLVQFLDELEEFTPTGGSRYQRWKQELAASPICRETKNYLTKALLKSYIEQVHEAPCNSSAHAHLATAYILVKKTAKEALQHLADEEEKKEKRREENRARQAALEELAIVEASAEKNPRLYEYLAASFRDLDAPQEEMRILEIFLKEYAQDPDALFRLGRLYFQNGKHADGLKIYENMEKGHPERAKRLLQYYGVEEFA